MKSILNLTLVILLLLAGACTMDMRDKNGSDKSTNVVASDTAKVVYQCPMKCESDTAYVDAGSCPVCKMDLEKITR